MDSIIAYEAGNYQHAEYMRQAREENAHQLPAGDSALRHMLTRLLKSVGTAPTAVATTTDNCRTAPDPLAICSS